VEGHQPAVTVLHRAQATTEREAHLTQPDSIQPFARSRRPQQRDVFAVAPHDHLLASLCTLGELGQVQPKDPGAHDLHGRNVTGRPSEIKGFCVNNCVNIAGEPRRGRGTEHMFYTRGMRLSSSTTTIQLRRSRQRWEAWEEREASCELLGSAAVGDVRAAYSRLAHAISDRGAGPMQRWLLDTGQRSRQLVVRLDGATPELLLLDGDAAGLPVVLRWLIRSRIDHRGMASPHIAADAK
jgi:hypothetical protein